MYQSFVYIEARIQLPPVDSVFREDEKTHRISVDSDVLKKVLILSRALGCTVPDLSDIEHITGNIIKPETEKNFTGYSI